MWHEHDRWKPGDYIPARPLIDKFLKRSNTMEFVKGDRVVVAGYSDSGVNTGDRGRVAEFVGSNIEVEFDNYNSYRWGIGPKRRPGHHWYMLPKQLKKEKTMQRIKSLSGHNVTIQSYSRLHVGCVAVTRAELEGLLRDLDDYQPPHRFKVGDWVRLTEKYMGIEPGALGKITRMDDGDDILYVRFPSDRYVFIWPRRVEKTDAPKPVFNVGDYVRLTRTFSNKGEYSRVTGAQGKDTPTVATGRLSNRGIRSYLSGDLDVVSEQEYCRNVTLKVGDKVHIIHTDDGRYVGENAAVRRIVNSLYDLEFLNYDTHRANYHVHSPGEPWGHIWTLVRSKLELVD